ncbi:MAG: AAA family ATPase, partial [Micrococcales bacterium]|nr:AAA family ATPase [Micrococcales bacterium]
MSLIERPAYLAAVRPFMDQPVVKVLTGLRRCGKSSLLELIADDLRQRGVADDRIVHLDFEAMELAGLTTAEALHAHLADTIDSPGRCYLLLDEIQEVERWEKVVNSCHATKDVDIYLTGSNSRLLSSELATYIAGRYVSIEVSTLSFAEHLAFADHAGQDTSDLTAQFDGYQRRGGFPGLFAASLSQTQHHRAVSDIYA